jgi:hypothetical protein
MAAGEIGGQDLSNALIIKHIDWKTIFKSVQKCQLLDQF